MLERELTPKQKRVLKFIVRRIWQERRPPTIREIAQNFKFSSTGTVRDYLQALKTKGYLHLAGRKSRSIELSASKLWQIPVVAEVYAGSPTLTYENIEGYLNMEELLFHPEKEVFALRVKGESMAVAGIMPKDLVLVSRQQSCKNGDIIVALIDEETTIKYFYKRKEGVYLEPANKNYAPILVQGDFSIIGKVISVVRKYV